MMEDFAEIIGRRIKKKREKEDINQKELAEKVSVSPSAINQFEKGEKKPSTAILRKIALALSVSSDYLLGASDDEDLFISEDVATAFRGFKELSNKDKEIILGHIEYLESKAKNSRKTGK